jgi:GTP pyrophosphokinase
MTIEFLSTERQHRYASRVLGIYSPVAEYVGLHYFKRLLEDISFKILFPIEAENLRKLLEKNNKYENKALILVREDVDKTLKQNNINDSEIEGRIKSLYSTYLKYKKNGKNSVKDRVGVRIILDSVSDCYMVLGLLHAKYKYLTEEFDDYISAPKANGYRSIQTTLLWKEGLTVEVQIRTREMHDFNEFGPASHIAYKLSKSDSKGVGYEWVKDLVKWQKSENKVNNYRIDVLANYIYVFTPKGDILQMPKYSTALDFAYRVHSSIGDRCNGAIINKKMAKLETELKTGDMVEIFTGKKINANKNWLRLVKTQFAKERIRKITNVKDADDKQ